MMMLPFNALPSGQAFPRELQRFKFPAFCELSSARESQQSTNQTLAL